MSEFNRLSNHLLTDTFNISIPPLAIEKPEFKARIARDIKLALYVRSSLPLSAWTFSGDDRTFELLCSCVNGTFIGSLYHPPRPAYTVQSLLNYIEQCVVELNRDYPSSNIVLAGEFNLLPESALVDRTGFDQLVQQPTRGVNTLDLVFVSRPMYDVTRVVDSVVERPQSSYCVQ